MYSKDTITHERQVTVSLDEKELGALLAKEVAKKMSFEINDETKIKVTFRKEDAIGHAGFEQFADVKLINNLDT